MPKPALLHSDCSDEHGVADLTLRSNRPIQEGLQALIDRVPQGAAQADVEAADILQVCAREQRVKRFNLDLAHPQGEARLEDERLAPRNPRGK